MVDHTHNSAETAYDGAYMYQGSEHHNEELRKKFVGMNLKDLPTPSAIVNRAAVKENCDRMLDAVDKLGMQFRAHIKTHKTLAVTKMQVGDHGQDDRRPVRLIVSTVAEFEHILPYIIECHQSKRVVSVLYGVPASPSNIKRLVDLVVKAKLGMQVLAFMVDHPDTLDEITSHHARYPTKTVGSESHLEGIPIFVKIDTGYGRAGVKPDSEILQAIAQKLKANRQVELLGLYSHLGSSYGFSQGIESVKGLYHEFDVLAKVAKDVFRHKSSNELTLSVGATPTASAVQVIVNGNASTATFSDELEREKLAGLDELQQDCKGFPLEVHAGVYPFLDLQQMATNARMPAQGLSYDNIALRILVEVASIYPERDSPEALIAAGSLALGREPCKSYDGWGVVTPWPKIQQDIQFLTPSGFWTPDNLDGWFVAKISQEHGILRWQGQSQSNMRQLRIGEKLMVWPNHACIAGAGFGWYFVVDTSDDSKGEKVVDVWPRCRGW